MTVAATTSAANLRSGAAQKTSMRRTDLLNSIDALAKKYDCVSGERGLEDIISEISTKNSATKAALNVECKKTLDQYDQEFHTAQLHVKSMRDNAEGEAEVIRADEVGKVQKRHSELIEKHKKAVADAKEKVHDTTTTFTSKESNLGEMIHKHSTEKISVEAEVASLGQENDAAVLKAEESFAKGLRIAKDEKQGAMDAAANLKKSDDKLCTESHDTFEEIIRSDTAIVTQLKTLMGDMNALGQRHSTFAESLLEVKLRAKVHANYDKLLTAKNDEIVTWNKVCASELKAYDDALLSMHTKAVKIRDTTHDKHAVLYNQVKKEEDTRLQKVIDEHAKIVSQKSLLSQDAEAAVINTQSKVNNRESVYTSTKQEVDDEQKAYDDNAKRDNDDIEVTRKAKVEEATSFHKSSVDHSTQTQTDSLEECALAFNTRSALITKDQAVIDEISPLLNDLKACSQSGTSLMEVDNKKGQTLLSATQRAQQKVSCALSATKLQQVTKKSTTSFLEQSHSKMATEQAAAAKALKLAALKVLSSPTTGSLTDWQKRIDAENAKTDSIRKECVVSANKVYKETKGAADKMFTDRTSSANSAAKRDTGAVDAAHKAKTTLLSARLEEVETPYRDAQSAAAKAKIDASDASDILTSAQDLQTLKVSGARTDFSTNVGKATKEHDEAVAADYAEAQKMDDDSKIEYDQNHGKKDESCKTELTHLTTEHSKLESIVFHLESLERANAGLSASDSDSMAKDIGEMESALATEKLKSAENFKTCLQVATDQQKKSVKGADDDFLKADEELNVRHGEAMFKAKQEKERRTTAADARAAANNNNLKSTQASHEQAKEALETAEHELKIASEISKSDVELSQGQLDSITKLAAEDKKRSIARTLEEAKVVEDAAESKHSSETGMKTSECAAENAILDDEKTTLDETLNSIQKLTTINNDQLGAENDAEKLEPKTTTKTTLKQSLNFDGVSCDMIDAPEKKANIEAVLRKEMHVAEPALLFITSIGCDDSSTSFLEVASKKAKKTAALKSKAKVVAKSKAKASTKAKVVAKTTAKVSTKKAATKKAATKAKVVAKTKAKATKAKATIDKAKAKKSLSITYEIITTSASNAIEFTNRMEDISKNVQNKADITTVVAKAANIPVATISLQKVAKVSKVVVVIKDEKPEAAPIEPVAQPEAAATDSAYAATGNAYAATGSAAAATGSAAAATGATDDTTQSQEPECKNVPSTCTDCMEFAYCLTAPDQGCMKAPAHCTESCAKFVHCMDANHSGFQSTYTLGTF